ncbi:hypothetical protein D3C78_1190790 [compost metagenome]
MARRKIGGEPRLEQGGEDQAIVAGKQPRQRRGYLRPFGSLAQGAQVAGHPLLVIVVAGEIEPPLPEPQRPTGGITLASFVTRLLGANQGALGKQARPAARIRKIRQQIPALLRIQPERAQGSLSVTRMRQQIQRQADVAATQLEAGERRPQHQLGAAAKIGHQLGKLQIQLADAARQRQGLQPFDDHPAAHDSTSFHSCAPAAGCAAPSLNNSSSPSTSSRLGRVWKTPPCGMPRRNR